MKVGLISDVHGDIDGLDRALALLDAHPVDTILCAGDLIDRGGHDQAVIARIRERNIPTVKGNHDHRVQGTHQMMQRDSAYREQLIAWGQQVFTDDEADYLANLPRMLRFEWEGVRVLMAHGTPSHLDTYLFPNALPHALKRVVEDANADVVILGHTHVPMLLRVDQTLIMNPGSVHFNYQAPEGEQTCAILELPSRTFTIFDTTNGNSHQIDVILRQLPQD